MILITTTGSSHTRGVYHTDPECNSLSENHREISQDVLETMDLRECRYCADEYEHDGGSFEYQRMIKQAAKE